MNIILIIDFWHEAKNENIFISRNIKQRSWQKKKKHVAFAGSFENKIVILSFYLIWESSRQRGWEKFFSIFVKNLNSVSDEENTVSRLPRRFHQQ